MAPSVSQVAPWVSGSSGSRRSRWRCERHTCCLIPEASSPREVDDVRGGRSSHAPANSRVRPDGSACCEETATVCGCAAGCGTAEPCRPCCKQAPRPRGTQAKAVRCPRDSQAKLPRQREGAAFEEGPRHWVRKNVAFRTRAQEARPATEAEKEQLKSFALWLALLTVTRQLLQFPASRAQMTMPRGREETVSYYAFAFKSRNSFPRIPPAGSPSNLVDQNWPSGPSPQSFTARGQAHHVTGTINPSPRMASSLCKPEQSLSGSETTAHCSHLAGFTCASWGPAYLIRTREWSRRDRRVF
ncbi:uncharacterized protein LOC120234106 [Hyaena hyaena]|uniref:uncharacterized protein LOC120234106 n=1 Tax=Hyaena hyaena TaxID=95912 RepID=UPI001921DD88|nr:uncharacterized protein LOC120234106 [Hyaena hyaena]